MPDYGFGRCDDHHKIVDFYSSTVHRTVILRETSPAFLGNPAGRMRGSRNRLSEAVGRVVSNNGLKWGYLFGQKRRKVGRLQRQAARCFLVTQEASSVELGTWCWPRVVLIEKRPLTEYERSSMNRAARSVGARRVRRLCRNNWIWRLPAAEEFESPTLVAISRRTCSQRLSALRHRQGMMVRWHDGL
jgi:hypothetical protein